jgi:hypothetical protein
MQPDTLIKVNNTRDLINNSTLHEDSKELLNLLLESAAKAANGTPDKLNAIGDTLLAFCLYEIRSSVRFPSQLKTAAEEAVKSHTDSCPMRNVTANMPKYATYLYPFRWQACIILCIVSFAPNAANILNTIFKIVMN